MAVRQVEILELGQLLGSLLRSIIEAQEQSARATVEFIEAVGLVTTDESGESTSALRTVTMRYRKRDANGVLSEFEVEVPVLTLVNPPTLTVAEATLKFGYEVLAAERSVPTTSLRDTQEDVIAVEHPIRLRGIVRSSPSTDKSTEARTSFAVDVNVVVRQDPTPVGVQRLFNLAELGIRERPGSTAEVPVPPS
jgi:hypothetical protein